MLRDLNFTFKRMIVKILIITQFNNIIMFKYIFLNIFKSLKNKSVHCIKETVQTKSDEEIIQMETSSAVEASTVVDSTEKKNGEPDTNTSLNFYINSLFNNYI